MKMMRRICFRLAGDTGVAGIFVAGGKSNGRAQSVAALTEV